MWEDPTQMPSYQWVVQNKRAGIGSPFKLTNREFKNVSFDYVYVYASGDSVFKIGDPKYSGTGFAKEKYALIRSGLLSKEEALNRGEFARAESLGTDAYSFLRLSTDVKSDQLLGYRYIDRDSTVVDVYAFKYYHFLATGKNAYYMGWNGYDDPKMDSIVYIDYRDYHDKLYFSLQEMPYENIGEKRVLVGFDTDGSKLRDYDDYKSIYDYYGNLAYNYVNRDSIVLENFGYMPTHVVKGETVYNYKIEGLEDLKPLARQAYRIMLKDYYKFSPTVRGDYLTVGQEDNYILADRANALRPYVPASANPEGVFGLPYFYFRNTNFNIPGVNAKGEDVNENYFALVQRLDTVSIVDGFQYSYDDVYAYISDKFTTTVADRITDQIKKSKELGAFIATVADNSTKLKFAVRGDIAVAPSTFTLERDEDPLYRRFNVNDNFPNKTYKDDPLVLEFHRLNNSNYRLFENSGGDTRTGGGYEYNLNKQGKLQEDSLGNIISFLGIKNIAQFPSVTAADDPHVIPATGKTNYAIYVDTAFINRGTGWIKPQYMLVVDHKIVNRCDKCGDPTDIPDYTIGRYLFNTSMYAKKVTPSAADIKEIGGNGLSYDLVQPVDVDVIKPAVGGVDGYAYTRAGNTKWERLAFAWAIHRGDSLYVLKNVAPNYQTKPYDVEDLVAKLLVEYGNGSNLDFGKLELVKGWSKGQLGDEGKTIGLHAIIDLNDNTHKDWVFSFRYIQRRADDFIIESETTDRDRVNSPVIRPGYGGWVKYDNNVPIITRSDTKELLGEGYITNVTISDIEPVSNAPVAGDTGVKVIGGENTVTVLNATGKSVVVTNALGQTLANTVAKSDNASISVASGIVFVSVDGGSAVKALVK
jgi:hypothetical protein